MKKANFTMLFLIMILGTRVSAQETAVVSGQRFGNTLNLGIGIGYYGYLGNSIPVFHADYEFNVARNFTLAPFINIFTYQNNYYWGDPNNPYRDYSYRETVIPIGIKGKYYFDELLHANRKWDFYLGASLGFAIVSTTWENGYYGDRTVHGGPSSLFLDLHIGAEYHIARKMKLFLDLSTGVSTLGLGFHI